MFIHKLSTHFCWSYRRFDPSFYSLYKHVRSGDAGPVRIVKSTSRDFPFPPIDYLRTSGKHTKLFSWTCSLLLIY